VLHAIYFIWELLAPALGVQPMARGPKVAWALKFCGLRKGPDFK